MTDAPAATGAPSTLRSLWRVPLVADLVVLALAALVVQLAFPERVDLAAHVVAGGGLALVVAGFAPARVGERIAPIAVGACLVLAVVSERLQPGVLDWGDVAYTGAGSLLMARSTSSIVRSDRTDRVLSVAVGAGAIVLGLVLRYGR